jgi:hypothetical protein
MYIINFSMYILRPRKEQVFLYITKSIDTKSMRADVEDDIPTHLYTQFFSSAPLRQGETLNPNLITIVAHYLLLLEAVFLHQYSFYRKIRIWIPPKIYMRI